MFHSSSSRLDKADEWAKGVKSSSTAVLMMFGLEPDVVWGRDEKLLMVRKRKNDAAREFHRNDIKEALLIRRNISIFVYIRSSSLGY